MTNAQHDAMIARMSPDELAAYSRGLSNAYADVFRAFTKAFADGRDIHWLRDCVVSQWDDIRKSYQGKAL
jgi:hypothetical protein